MRLRIISGNLKGRYIQLAERDAGFRPTLERARQSVVEILKNSIEESRAADICAGSGAFGFELLSRGASWVDFVEIDRMRVTALRDNARLLGVEDRCEVFMQDAGGFAGPPSGGYDIIYYDPPYDDTVLSELIGKVGNLLSVTGILCHEHRKHRRPPRSAEGFSMTGTRLFGDTAVDFYSRGH